jgi:hypothetical protein
MSNNSMSSVMKLLRTGSVCGLGAIALGVILYACLVNPPKTLELMESCVGWLKLMTVFLAGLVWMPINLVYQTLANLPLGLQVASLCAWLWSLCVCVKLERSGDTGPAYLKMLLAKRVLFALFSLIVMAYLIKCDFGIYLLMFCLCAACLYLQQWEKSYWAKKHEAEKAQ